MLAIPHEFRLMDLIGAGPTRPEGRADRFFSLTITSSPQYEPLPLYPRTR